MPTIRSPALPSRERAGAGATSTKWRSWSSQTAPSRREEGAKVSTAVRPRPELPELPLTEWEPTKNTLHLWAQIVGKVRLASTAPRNHWWHVPLYVDVRGLTTRRMHAKSGVSFEIDFDFVDHRLAVATNGGAVESFELVDGLSVAEFDEKLHTTLARLGVDVTIRETPYEVPMTTPFPADREHAAYDRDAVERFWRILDWTDEVFEEFAGWYCGKTSPVHLFWHSFDLALSRFGGRRARTPLPARLTRTRWSRSASGQATKTCASRPITRTPRQSRPAFVSDRCIQRKPSGPTRRPARSPFCATRRCELPPTRGQRCSLSWRAPIRPVPVHPAGTAPGSSHPGVPTRRS